MSWLGKITGTEWFLKKRAGKYRHAMEFNTKPWNSITQAHNKAFRKAKKDLNIIKIGLLCCAIGAGIWKIPKLYQNIDNSIRAKKQVMVLEENLDKQFNNLVNYMHASINFQTRRYKMKEYEPLAMSPWAEADAKAVFRELVPAEKRQPKIRQLQNLASLVNTMQDNELVGSIGRQQDKENNFDYLRNVLITSYSLLNKPEQELLKLYGRKRGPLKLKEDALKYFSSRTTFLKERKTELINDYTRSKALDKTDLVSLVPGKNGFKYDQTSQLYLDRIRKEHFISISIPGDSTFTIEEPNKPILESDWDRNINLGGAVPYIKEKIKLKTNYLTIGLTDSLKRSIITELIDEDSTGSAELARYWRIIEEKSTYNVLLDVRLSLLNLMESYREQSQKRADYRHIYYVRGSKGLITYITYLYNNKKRNSKKNNPDLMKAGSLMELERKQFLDENKRISKIANYLEIVDIDMNFISPLAGIEYTDLRKNGLPSAKRWKKVKKNPQPKGEVGQANLNNITKEEWYRAFHNAVDVPGRIGEFIIASEDGTLRHVGYLEGLGYTVILNHKRFDSEYITVYGHQQGSEIITSKRPGIFEINPFSGQNAVFDSLQVRWLEGLNIEIKQGDVIGKIGMSGNLYNALWTDDINRTDVDMRKSARDSLMTDMELQITAIMDSVRTNGVTIDPNELYDRINSTYKTKMGKDLNWCYPHFHFSIMKKGRNGQFYYEDPLKHVSEFKHNLEELYKHFE